MVLNQQCRFILLFVTIQTSVFFSSFSWAKDLNAEICRKELATQIRNLIKKDEGKILNQAFNIANLKLAYKVIKNQGAKKTLEDHVKEQIKKLNKEDKANLVDELRQLYTRYGKYRSQAQILNIINGLDKHNYYPKSERLSNEDTTIVMLAYEKLDPATKTSMRINSDDVAITWFMDQLHKHVGQGIDQSSTTNLLLSSVRMTRMTGHIDNYRALSLQEIEDKIESLKVVMSLKFDKLKNDFLSRYQDCTDLLGGKACVLKEIKQEFDKSLIDIMREIQTQDKIAKLDGNLKIKLLDGLTLNLVNSIVSEPNKAYQSLNKNPPQSVDRIPSPFDMKLPSLDINGDSPVECSEGDDFESEIRNTRVHGYDWSRTLMMGKNRIQHGNLTQWGPRSKVGSFFNKLCPTSIPVGPFFQMKCSPFMKLFKINEKKAEAKVCCENKISWEPYGNYMLSVSGGIEGKIFVGIPDYIPIVKAQIGGMVGISAGISASGGGIPQACGEKKCFEGTARINLYGGLYLEVGATFGHQGTRSSTLEGHRAPFSIGGEFKLAWKPHVMIRQCLYPAGNLPPAQRKVTIGKLWLQGTFYVGWLYSYDYYRPLFESKKQDTTDMHLF